MRDSSATSSRASAIGHNARRPTPEIARTASNPWHNGTTNDCTLDSLRVALRLLDAVQAPYKYRWRDNSACDGAANGEKPS